MSRLPLTYRCRMSSNIVITSVLVVVTLLTATAASSAETPAGIYQIVESANGSETCVGFVIQLSKLRFPATIKSGHITITEAKHGHDITDLMIWEVDSQRRRLTVRFKPNRGDFGTGNRVGVQIDLNIIEGNSDTGHAFWGIGTDPL